MHIRADPIFVTTQQLGGLLDNSVNTNGTCKALGLEGEVVTVDGIMRKNQLSWHRLKSIIVSSQKIPHSFVDTKCRSNTTTLSVLIKNPINMW